MIYVIDVFYGEFVSRVHVEAGSKREARLVAEQLAYTPHAGKPEHIQIIGTLSVET